MVFLAGVRIVPVEQTFTEYMLTAAILRVLTKEALLLQAQLLGLLTGYVVSDITGEQKPAMVLKVLGPMLVVS
jgi:hypothetical protein